MVALNLSEDIRPVLSDCNNHRVHIKLDAAVLCMPVQAGSWQVDT